MGEVIGHRLQEGGGFFVWRHPEWWVELLKGSGPASDTLLDFHQHLLHLSLRHVSVTLIRVWQLQVSRYHTMEMMEHKTWNQMVQNPKTPSITLSLCILGQIPYFPKAFCPFANKDWHYFLCTLCERMKENKLSKQHRERCSVAVWWPLSIPGQFSKSLIGF